MINAEPIISKMKIKNNYDKVLKKLIGQWEEKQSDLKSYCIVVVPCSTYTLEF